MSIKRLPALLFVLVLATLAACAKPAILDDTGINKSITPASANADIAAARGQRVRWGGVIISSNNLKNDTQMEVLAYPLDKEGRPRRDQTPLGRFIAIREGYLETVDYAAGRAVTFTGQIRDTRESKVGEASYNYPVLAVDQIHLWTDERSWGGGSQFHFGIGVGIGL